MFYRSFQGFYPRRHPWSIHIRDPRLCRPETDRSPSSSGSKFPTCLRRSEVWAAASKETTARPDAEHQSGVETAYITLNFHTEAIKFFGIDLIRFVWTWLSTKIPTHHNCRFSLRTPQPAAAEKLRLPRRHRLRAAPRRSKARSAAAEAPAARQAQRQQQHPALRHGESHRTLQRPGRPGTAGEPTLI